MPRERSLISPSSDENREKRSNEPALKHERSDMGFIPLTVFADYLGRQCTLVIKGGHRKSGIITQIGSGKIYVDREPIPQMDIDGIIE